MTDLAVGDSFETSRTFTAEDVRAFTDLSGDAGGHHVEPDADGRLLVHGLLTATLATELGGRLDVLASRMDYRFPRPVYTGQRIVCTFEIDAVEPREDGVGLTATATATNPDGETVLSGTIEGVVRDD